MAVKSSGANLSIAGDIVAEFGGSAPHAMSEYYGGGDLVPSGANPGIPAETIPPKFTLATAEVPVLKP